MKLTPDQWHALIFAAVALLLAALGFVVWWRRRPRDPAEVERRRRAYLNQVGRIVEGHILEISDESSPGAGLGMQMTAAKPQHRNGFHKMVFYSYSISGVTYETAQDITGMEERICLERVVAGQHISVKYDPDNPSNSILMADDWSGLH